MPSPRRPSTTVAMRELIQEIRATIPLDLPEAQVCSDGCNACSMKLLEYLSAELDNWEARLQAGETPGLAELSQLARSARKIHRVLQKNGLIPRA
ncbi:hypothetical protein [Thiolapillus sp.]